VEQGDCGSASAGFRRTRWSCLDGSLISLTAGGTGAEGSQAWDVGTTGIDG
jgi:hypothetical protein